MIGIVGWDIVVGTLERSTVGNPRMRLHGAETLGGPHGADPL